MQNVEDDVTLAAPYGGGRQGESAHRPFPWAEKVRVFLVEGTHQLATCDDKVVAVVKQGAKVQKIARRKSSLWKEYDDSVPGCDRVGVHVRSIQAAFWLPVYGDSAILEVGHRAIGTSAVDGKYLIKNVKGKFRYIMLTALQFVPNNQAERNSHAGAPTVSVCAI
jgi:hypothetical protein